MNSPLGKRHMKALEALRYEVDYEDHHKGGTENYILRSGLPAGIGEETLADLVKAGLAVMGPYRWSDGTGYRITQSGRAALDMPLSLKPATPKRKLQPLPPRFGKDPSRQR